MTAHQCHSPILSQSFTFYSGEFCISQTNLLTRLSKTRKRKEGAGLSWKKFDRKIATVALVLKNKLGLKPGMHVILMYTHSEEFVIAVYACLVTGIIPVPLRLSTPTASMKMCRHFLTSLRIIRSELFYSIMTLILL